MLDIFTRDRFVPMYNNAGGVIDSSMEIINEINHDFINNTNHNLFINNSHFMVKLIASMINKQSMDVAIQSGMNAAHMLGCTSIVKEGGIFEDVFFPHSKEIIIIDDDTMISHPPWKSIKPIKINRHGFTDIGVSVPMPSVRIDPPTFDSVCLINIDITLLASMTMGYRKENPDGSIKNLILKYIYPKLSNDIMRIAWYNRLIAHDMGMSLSSYVPWTSKSYRDVSKLVLPDIRRVMKRRKRLKMVNTEMLFHTLPVLLLGDDNFITDMRIDALDITFVHQAIVVSNLSYFEYAIHSGVVDRRSRNDLVVILKRFTDRPYSMYKPFLIQINNILGELQ